MPLYLSYCTCRTVPVVLYGIMSDTAAKRLVLKCEGACLMVVCIIKVLNSLMRVSVNWLQKVA